MLLRSRHLKGLKFLLSIQAFNKEALEQAESIAHILTERAVQEKEERISKKKVHNERLKQFSSASSKTMFHHFGAAKNEKNVRL